MKALAKKYRRYAGGGGMDLPGTAATAGLSAAGGGDPYSAAIAMAQQLISGAVNEYAPTNEFGHQGAIAESIKGNMKLGTIGAITGYYKGRQQMREDKWKSFANEYDQKQQEYKRGAAAVSADPALVSGRPGEQYYAMGGTLKGRYYDAVKATGGDLKPLSSDAAEVEGPEHEQGGVDLPQFNSQVEGGETMQDNYVFSDRLGFAKIHRRLATAIGKVEQKPATPDRINSLNRMRESVENLKNQQEQVRSQYNLQ